MEPVDPKGILNIEYGRIEYHVNNQNQVCLSTAGNSRDDREFLTLRDRKWYFRVVLTLNGQGEWEESERGQYTSISEIDTQGKQAPPTFRKKIVDAAIAAWKQELKQKPDLLILGELRSLGYEMSHARRLKTEAETQLAEAIKEMAAIEEKMAPLKKRVNI